MAVFIFYVDKNYGNNILDTQAYLPPFFFGFFDGFFLGFRFFSFGTFTTVLAVSLNFSNSLLLILQLLIFYGGIFDQPSRPFTANSFGFAVNIESAVFGSSDFSFAIFANSLAIMVIATVSVFHFAPSLERFRSVVSRAKNLHVSRLCLDALSGTICDKPVLHLWRSLPLSIQEPLDNQECIDIFADSVHSALSPLRCKSSESLFFRDTNKSRLWFPVRRGQALDFQGLGDGKDTRQFCIEQKPASRFSLKFDAPTTRQGIGHPYPDTKCKEILLVAVRSSVHLPKEIQLLECLFDNQLLAGRLFCYVIYDSSISPSE
jgi:hypothetical protein